MKEKIGKYILLALVWAIVIGYVVYSVVIMRAHRMEQVVRRVEIEVADSTANGHLVSSRMVREWILHSGISTIGVPANEVNLAGIEGVVAKNGFVDRADSYVSYDGVLHIEVRQRRPMLRLLIDGYDTYATEEGFVFRSPAASALYVPVVTGGYRPPFSSDYEGLVEDYVEAKIRESNSRIEQIEKTKIPLYKIEDSLRKERKAVRAERTKRKYFYKASGERAGFRFCESDEEFDERIRKLRADKHRRVRKIDAVRRHNAKMIDAVTARSDAEYRAQKKLRKRYEDFLKLLNFVEQIEDDGFWSAEIVQIVAKTTPSGALELELVPRSGDYTILFGGIENVELKLKKLLRFYKDGLNNIGWDTYSIINVKYDGQVVCSK